jgi:hypothetical protein
MEKISKQKDNMKNLPTFEEFINESVETEILNEDASLIMSIMVLGQSTAMLAAAMVKAGVGEDWPSIADWWTKWKKDRRVNKILDKLNADTEVQQFLSLPNKQQEGKWQKLIDTKLDKDEKDLLKAISRDRVKKGKI